MKSKLRNVRAKTNQRYTALMFSCPGCAEINGGDGIHMLAVNSPEQDPSWWWNGDLDKPTMKPSILSHCRDGRKCHSFIKNGEIQFLADCDHSFAGQTVPLPDLPDWVVNME